ncbi:N-6 DNA methylase [Streptomyces polyrhachis]|uniref:N-6 DNA methylase n=1 Tax=Streptomyces polyrhachis TaxID=1282885 RepID=A0ABW2GJ15_9ACTN
MPDAASRTPPAQAAPTTVTAAGIARLAGVGRAAVSNWRRRHTDFPRPVGGTETSPHFDLAEVEAWLRAQGKIGGVPQRERVWQLVAGHPGGAPAGLALAGAVLLLVHEHPARWLELAALKGPAGTESTESTADAQNARDAQSAPHLAGALAEVLTERLGPEHPVRLPPAAPHSELVRATADLAAEFGEARGAYEFLLGRYLETNPRQHTLTPPELAVLVAGLAVPPGPTGPGDRAATVLDPAAGAATLLLAAPGDGPRLAQESDPDLAALAALRLALHTPGRVRTAAADTLRADALAGRAADAVVCHPPFNERNWGHDELAYDPRFGYGLPARTESELAWVQHALARLTEGGTAVLLMPPAVASRRSGRRIRAELLRRGALRAVIALPPGAAPPHSVPLHLWVLRRPPAGALPPSGLLFVDAGETYGTGRERIDWAALTADTLAAWRAYDRTGELPERPGTRAVRPVVELLDDDVDLTPARRLPPAPGGPAGTTPAELDAVRERLGRTLALAAERTPPAPTAAPAAAPPWTTVGELARAGALSVRTGGAGAGGAGAVLTVQDVLDGAAPSGTLPEGEPEEAVLLAEGDVVVPLSSAGGPSGPHGTARVVDAATAGAALGARLALLRPAAGELDPWFVAGFLRGTANARQAGVYATAAGRLDVRRLQLPRLPLERQRVYGAQFRSLAAFEAALRETSRLGALLAQGLYDGLADGTLGLAEE